ncbi:uncharacterized protein BXZ73DRAFT_100770 [Epithele typhae]|uniref:uncharacterized protein n=1 Tax=Epithele typhae TaxID=378194 RepID=UPI002008AF26|nr:uncharacterized protein BXZ73DRAFT_100770 [Epithele typhae]KAH9934579.1 hypothetical protein BXZ73DRAFT_100770 [Epithele typhae]
MACLPPEASEVILRSLGVATASLPRNFVLNKYLRVILDGSQHGLRAQPFHNLNLLPEWPQPDSSQRQARRLQHYTSQSTSTRAVAYDPTSLAQAVEHDAPDGAKRLFRDPLQGLRIAVLELAKLSDCGSPWLVLDDPDIGMSFVNIRVLSIRKLHARAPVFVVLYRAFDHGSAEGPMARTWVRAQIAEAPLDPRNKGVESNTFKGDIGLLKLLLTLLWMNQRLVPPGFPVQRRPEEADYQVSVLGPIGPPYALSVVGLEERLMCAVCKETPVKECSQCCSVGYCSKECQRKHWAVHRRGCLPRSGVRWVTFQAGTLRSDLSRFGPPPGSRLADSHRTTELVQYQAPTPLRPSKPFVLKLLPTGPSVLAQSLGFGDQVYGQIQVVDVKRALMMAIRPEDCTAVFEALRTELSGTKGIYRWAKRTGQWTYCVCVDRVPPAELSGW